MKTQKITITILFLLLFLIPQTLAIGNTITPINNPNILPPNQQIVTPQQMQDFYTVSETQTRNDIKQYADQKTAEAINSFKINGQAFIDANFAVLDKRLHDLAQEVFVKFMIGGIAILIFAQALWYFLRNKIENLSKRPVHLEADEYAHIVAGIISEEYKQDLARNQEAHKIMQKPQFNDAQTTIRPPTTAEIEEMIRTRRFAKEIKKAKDEAEKKKLNDEKEMKKAEAMIIKEQSTKEKQNKNQDKNKEINQKKLEQKQAELQKKLEAKGLQ